MCVLLILQSLSLTTVMLDLVSVPVAVLCLDLWEGVEVGNTLIIRQLRNLFQIQC